MARLNRPRLRGLWNALFTHEGAPARRIDAEQELRRSVLACLLWENAFYEGGVEIAERIASLAGEVAPEVVATLAIEARDEQHLRHVPLWLVRQLARRGGKIVADTLAHVVQRPDELAEFVALYWSDGRRPLPAQVKRGLARAFTKFDAYQLAKYDRPGVVRLRDVLFLCHPKPKDEEQGATWRALVDGTLPTPDTWEVALSRGADRRETWTRLITERKLGGLAMLRNLRNMQQAGVPDEVIREGIANARFDRVLPFRFLAAARVAPRFEPELEEGMFAALRGVSRLPGRTVLLVDHSGSMNDRLSRRAVLTRFDVASGLAILLREVCEHVEIVNFSTRPWSVAPRRGFALRDALLPGEWGGTYTERGKQTADALGYDRLVIITDEQSHQALSNPNGTGYVVNVGAYRHGIGYGAWTHIDGWSEGVVRYIAAVER